MNIDVYNQIKTMAERYEQSLKSQVKARMIEMSQDDVSHYLLYSVLGLSRDESRQLDYYENKARFVYRYAGSFLEEAAFFCIHYRYPDAMKTTISCIEEGHMRHYEIDCLVGEKAHEIKWRDATTDGDHVSKEERRVHAIVEHGYVPVRIMFYEPQRKQAKKIQEQLAQVYSNLHGEYYSGMNAWNYIQHFTGIDLLEILNRIAEVKKEV